MQTNDALDNRKDPHELDIHTFAAAIVVPVCKRLGLRDYQRCQHIAAVAFDMVSWDALGANEAELLSVGLMFTELAKTLKSPHPMDDRTLERMLRDADLADDHLWGVLKIDGETATGCDALAAAQERTMGLLAQAARRNRQKARAIRTGRAISRSQLHLPEAS